MALKRKKTYTSWLQVPNADLQNKTLKNSQVNLANNPVWKGSRPKVPLNNTDALRYAFQNLVIKYDNLIIKATDMMNEAYAMGRYDLAKQLEENAHTWIDWKNFLESFVWFANPDQIAEDISPDRRGTYEFLVVEGIKEARKEYLITEAEVKNIDAKIKHALRNAGEAIREYYSFDNQAKLIEDAISAMKESQKRNKMINDRWKTKVRDAYGLITDEYKNIMEKRNQQVNSNIAERKRDNLDLGPGMNRPDIAIPDYNQELFEGDYGGMFGPGGILDIGNRLGFGQDFTGNQDHFKHAGGGSNFDLGDLFGGKDTGGYFGDSGSGETGDTGGGSGGGGGVKPYIIGRWVDYSGRKCYRWKGRGCDNPNGCDCPNECPAPGDEPEIIFDPGPWLVENVTTKINGKTFIPFIDDLNAIDGNIINEI